MENHVTYGYAPVHAENGKLWVDECEGITKDRFKIYDSEQAAELNRVNQSDRVARVKIEVLA